ncbi:hypothetical protein TVAG_052920 [Trichomonas vaginalis G3]|uniref:Uncharacterized protein n=1 Tax=Trichomonas vaginalis (strain ATCC PRA-98 / G3) TaxID=412133 RepID=A2F6K4_TRIV3|nr:guanylate cyclase protein [Trichomonas vaginalis G3]EAX99449.1 hypothetical protein TVAG_052920 [Trichomonas vaginalis G3]KAI5541615.1 guanylate cyclase protein [Trichomonas vaginalis G3]|eukprot:XP_001312379.1 hypothetical protein [Trichomonas vaginalis G3]
MLSKAEWGLYYFVLFAGICIVVFLLSYLFIKRRERSYLRILDEIESTNEVSMISTKKFKQLVITGFMYSHPSCVDFSIFKLAINQWREHLDIWAVYAKFAAIYPENTSTLLFIIQNVNLINNKSKLAKIVCSNASYITKTRETRYTPELKSKVSKLMKQFSKTRNQLRNIWDLILQGSVNEMSPAIVNAYQSVKESEVEVNYLKMLYPNNRFVYRNYAKFLHDIKGDAIGYKKSIDDIARLQRGIRIVEDTINYLGMQAFPKIPDYLVASDTIKNNPTAENTESFAMEQETIEDDVNIEAIESISKQINNHTIPSIRFMKLSTIVCFIIFTIIPIICANLLFDPFANELRQPIYYMKGIAFCRNLINIMPAVIGKYMMEKLIDPATGNHMMDRLHLIDNFPMSAYGDYRNSVDIVRYFAQSVSAASQQMSGLRSFKIGDKHIEKVRDYIFANSQYFFFYLTVKNFTKSRSSSNEISYMIANHVGKLLDLPEITPDVVKGPDSLIARNNNNLPTAAKNSALEEMINYIKDYHELHDKFLLAILLSLISINVITYIFIAFYMLHILKFNREQTLGVLTTLPKTVVSNISYSLNKLKDGSDKSMNTDSMKDAEISRQEESIIKLFSSITDGSTSTSMHTLILYCLLFIVIATCGAYYLMIDQYSDSLTTLVHNCHHINYLYGSITFLYIQLWQDYLRLLLKRAAQNLKVHASVSQMKFRISRGFYHYKQHIS